MYKARVSTDAENHTVINSSNDHNHEQNEKKVEMLMFKCAQTKALIFKMRPNVRKSGAQM